MENIRHDEMISQMFTRLYEMDDILDMMSTGTLHHFALATKQDDLRQQDAAYIEAKISDLHKHAERAFRDLMNEQSKLNSQATRENSRDEALIRERLKQQQALKSRIEAVDSVIDAIQTKRVRGGRVSLEEYEQLLDALVQGHGGDAIKQEAQNVREVRQVWERQRKNDYKSVDVDSHKSEMVDLKQKQIQKREEFLENFGKVLNEHENSHGNHFQRSLHQVLSDLPEHCLKEMEWLSRIFWTCWIVLLSLGVSVYLQVTQQVVELVQ
eukprot:TRINITY_DN13724_c0_g3_i1.p1 TRINITY_DN13724_c0_g3~~TRINITY_DN13724_c0_g3_i1.p1  ORF type:complete len:268 (-),score=20.93 TRINITY_DN13724_c0_g3_i1:120-923(-)